MVKKVLLLLFFILSNIIYTSLCWAEAATLIKIEGTHQENLSRIYFFFDQIPEFEIENSGQRIQLVLSQTSFPSSLAPLASDHIIFHMNLSEDFQESVVDIYLRNMPKFVDVTVDRKYVRLVVNIFWDDHRLGGRPAILDKKIGELKPIEGGSVAQQMISSKYAGRWIDFFDDFELPVALSLPVHFSFPPFPSPLVVENLTCLPQDLQQDSMERVCDYADENMTAFLANTTNSVESDFFKLLKAECLLRKKSYQAALDFLENEPVSANDISKGWEQYYLSYARATSGHYYRAINPILQKETKLLKINNLAPWYRILKAELELAREKPENAMAVLNQETELDEELFSLYALRKGDSLYKLFDWNHAFKHYEEASLDIDQFQKYPESMGHYADMLYKNGDFPKAYRYYLVLSEILKEQFPKQKALADFRSAMAILKTEGKASARLLLKNIHEKNPDTEAGFRARMKLMDLDLLEDFQPLGNHVLTEYEKIADVSPTRMLREEAFFKKILVCHLYEDDLKAIKYLGRFFDQFWAGKLMPEARALFVEVFPRAIQVLVDEHDSLVALSLVAKHRDLLAQAHITYDFLNDLAQHYYQAGFLEQAENTYLYMLDFEKDREKKRDIYISLIETCYQQEKYEQAENYASHYLEKYPEGPERDRVLYYYANMLLNKGDVQTAAGLLLDKNRPRNKDLDRLAAMLFLEMGQYDLAEHYFSGIMHDGKDPIDPNIILNRAEALFRARHLEKAATLYELLLDTPPYGGQAGYRLIQIYLQLGQNDRAFKLYDKLTEKKTETLWLELATETVQTQKYLNMDN